MLTVVENSNILTQIRFFTKKKDEKGVYIVVALINAIQIINEHKLSWSEIGTFLSLFVCQKSGRKINAGHRTVSGKNDSMSGPSRNVRQKNVLPDNFHLLSPSRLVRLPFSIPCFVNLAVPLPSVLSE